MSLQSSNLQVLNHPLAYEELVIIRNQDTQSAEFRAACRRLTHYVVYETYRNMTTQLTTVTTPLKTTDVPVLAEPEPVIVGIWRAGQIMIDAALELLPRASARHLGMYRDESTHEPKFYYKNLPDSLEGKSIILVDPMLATGGSASYTIKLLAEAGVEGKDIRLLCLVGCPEGVETVHALDETVSITLGALDEKLNNNAYIIPGLGDAGDRINGTL